MAAVTVNSSIYGYTGHRRMISANLSIANTNTWVTGLQLIDSFNVSPSAGATLGGTVSGGTITFAATSSDAAAQVTVFGI